MESATGASHALVGEGEGVHSALVIQDCFNRLADQHAPSPVATFHAWLVKHAHIIHVEEVPCRVQWQLSHVSCAILDLLLPSNNDSMPLLLDLTEKLPCHYPVIAAVPTNLIPIPGK
jgi:hypothetical protein